MAPCPQPKPKYDLINSRSMILDTSNGVTVNVLFENDELVLNSKINCKSASRRLILALSSHLLSDFCASKNIIETT